MESTATSGLPRRAFLHRTLVAGLAAAIGGVPLGVTAASAAAPWWGWDPESTATPPLLPDLPWHTNTGVWRAEDRAALKVRSGDVTTSANGQVIDLQDIHGRLIVKHTGVVVKRSWLRRIENTTSSPVRVIHCDLGDGEAGDYKLNGTKGVVQLHRCNVFGVTDAVMTQGSGRFVLQDNFVHDLRYAHDSTQSGDNTHNDAFQINSSRVDALVRHNTFWCWTMDDRSQAQTCSRSSGPNWTDRGDPLRSTGYRGGTGGAAHGLQNAGIMVGSVKDYNPRLVIDGNLFRGYVYYYLNIQNGYVEVTNNLFAVDEAALDRRPGVISGRRNVDKWSNNRRYDTGALLS